MTKKGKIRSDIGARNPYAIIENLEKRSINWKKKPRDEIRFLFRKHFGMKLEDVFGSPDSPLLRKTGTGSALPGCTDAWTDYVDYPGGAYISGAPHPDDVVQGCTPDCYYLASLYSLAWVTPASIVNQSSPYSFTFYYPPHTADNPSNVPIKAPSISVKGPLPLKKITQPDGSTKYQFVYARSTTPASEIWPAIFEKAYAEFIKVSSADGDPDHPDISKIGEGSPFETLVNLTGLNLALDDTTSLTANYSSGDEIFTKIQQSMCTAGTKKASKPGVAFTFRTGSYSDDKLVANHTYSILGWHTESSKNYIVLRNPYGPTWFKDPKMYDAGGSLATGSWAPLPLGRKLNQDDGIFGLRADLFRDYFEAFNWVG